MVNFATDQNKYQENVHGLCSMPMHKVNIGIRKVNQKMLTKGFTTVHEVMHVTLDLCYLNSCKD